MLSQDAVFQEQFKLQFFKSEQAWNKTWLSIELEKQIQETEINQSPHQPPYLYTGGALRKAFCSCYCLLIS